MTVLILTSGLSLDLPDNSSLVVSITGFGNCVIYPKVNDFVPVFVFAVTFIVQFPLAGVFPSKATLDSLVFKPLFLGFKGNPAFPSIVKSVIGESVEIAVTFKFRSTKF